MKKMDINTANPIAKEVNPGCDSCDGVCRKNFNRFRVPFNRNGIVIYKPCKFAIVQRLKRVCSNANIPSLYQGKTFDDFTRTTDNDDALKLAKWFADGNTSKNLYLYGGCGTGKTFLASIIAQEFLRNEQSVSFADVPHLLSHLKKSFASDDTEFLLEKFSTVDLMILDDIGAELVTSWTASILYSIINRRGNEKKTTLLTSNYDLRGLERKLTVNDSFTGQRIISRIHDGYQAFLGTDDWRRK